MKIKVDEMIKEEGWFEYTGQPPSMEFDQGFSFVTVADHGKERDEDEFLPISAGWVNFFDWNDNSTDPEDVVTHFRVFSKEEVDKLWEGKDPLKLFS
jgi:hypothetical protein